MPASDYHSTKLIGGEIMNFTFQLLDFHAKRYKCVNSTTSDIHKLSEIDNCTVSDRYKESDIVDVVVARETPGQIVAAVLGLVFGLVMVYLVVYYYWWYFRFVWMTLRNSAILGSVNREQKMRLVRRRQRETTGAGGSGVEADGVDEEPAAAACVYDVFVSYCETNRNWILEEFLPNMDQCSDIRVCLHERDFQVMFVTIWWIECSHSFYVCHLQVGLSILENIIRCMDTSRCILLVVSENFLLSQWCQFEMHLAQHR